MSGFENINDYITVLDDVYAKKVNKTTFLLLMLAGLGVLFASTKLTSLYVVGVLLFCIAFGMIIIGLVGLTKPVERYFCKATKEPVEKQILYFDAADKEVVRAEDDIGWYRKQHEGCSIRYALIQLQCVTTSDLCSSRVCPD